jgi:3-(3-hydroxy-phenyl)propionate hydroxylase
VASTEYDVVVCGYGPVGQVATSLLARLGHRVLAVDKHPALYGMPRLCTINGEPVRIIAMAADIEAALHESSRVSGFEFRGVDGELLTTLDWGGKHPSGHGMRTSMYQPNIEDAIAAKAFERGAEVRMGWAAAAIAQGEDAVELTLAPRVDGLLEEAAAEVVSASYLIGADGANSFVREALAIDREDFGYREAFLSIDVERGHDLDGRFRNVAAKCDPGRTVATIPMGERRIRFEFIVNPDDDHTELLRPEVGYEMLAAEYGLTKDDVEIYRQVIFPFEGKIADRWRVGRVLLMGDAAHLMPPFLGEGAGSGLRDAINLAWKLDLVLRGKVGAELLDSYETERRPHVKVHVEGSIALAELACERDPVKAADRNENYRVGNIPPPPEEPTLTVGILQERDGDVLPPVGFFSPQDSVELDGRRGLLDDVLGFGFKLLVRGADPHDLLDAQGEAALETLGCRALRLAEAGEPGGLVDLEGTLGAFLDAHGIDAVLIRPDFYVFAVGARADVPALVDDLGRRLGLTVVAPAAVSNQEES